jgi:tetratricopeptide (TPR) repeat protein
MADRYMYIPSIGLFILAVWGADAISNSWTHKKVVLGTTAGVALACFLTCTWLQLQYWQNSEKLFRHAIETTKENYVAYNGLGNALHRRGRTDEAIPLFEKSLSIDPHYADALFNLGTAFMAKGNLNEAAKYFAAALSENPNFAHAHVNWGNVLLKQGQLDSAAEHYRKGISLVPDDAEMHYNLGTVLSLQSNRDEAILEFSKTTELEPSYGDAYNNLGIALIQQGKMIEGSTHLVKAVRLDPHNPKFRFNLALALDQQMKSREAISQYRETLNLRPDYPEALEGLAKILACNPDMNLRDGAEAVRLAERACELTNHQQPPMLMTLASAYAEAGRFPDALETAQKARALALTQDRYDWVHTTDKLIEHFKNGRAFGK